MPFFIVGFYKNAAVIILTGGRDCGHYGIGALESIGY
jgi:hypothetical protein